MTVANALTLFRALAGVPIFVALGEGERTFALVLFVLAAASDALDGVLARRGGTAEGHGMILDPLADKALVLLTLVGLALVGAAPAGRRGDHRRAGGVRRPRCACSRTGRACELPASSARKVKTACEMAAIALLIAAPPAGREASVACCSRPPATRLGRAPDVPTYRHTSTALRLILTSRSCPQSARPTFDELVERMAALHEKLRRRKLTVSVG